MPYTYKTLGQAVDDLGRRLYPSGTGTDPKFWSAAERTLYIQWALRTWNAFANYHRAEFVFQLTPTTIWYDIADTDIAPNTLRPFTITDVDLYTLIQHMFLEPATGATWTGTKQFDITDLLGAVQRRRDETVGGSSCTAYRKLYPAIPGRTFLNDKAIDIRRVAWIPATNTDGFTTLPLFPDDDFGVMSYEPDFTIQDPGTPSTYRRSTQPPLSFDVDCPPAVPGQYEVLTIDAGAALNTAAPTILNVPDDFGFVVMFGAMADLLSRDSNARDNPRAQYCNMRYRQGLALLQSAPAVLSARMNNLPVYIDAVQGADHYNPNWQAATPAAPGLVLTAALNLIGVSPPPAVGPYALTLSVLRNAPIPTANGQMIEVGRDEYDAVLDYAQHLAAFKMGGNEFLSTIPLFKRFMTQAQLYNSKLNALGEYTESIYAMSQAQARENPVYADATPATVMSDGGAA